MPEFITVTEKIERRTYLKGEFSGKFIGWLDAENSDQKTENFYDLEITDASVRARKTDFRVWSEGDESAEFSAVEKFLTKLPKLIPCEITYEDGSVKHFDLEIHEPKLKNHRLFNQLYEKDILYAAIEGKISGYLKHFDTVEKQIEIAVPEINTLTKAENQTPKNDFLPTTQAAASGAGNFRGTVNVNNSTANRGCLPTLGYSDSPTGGCLSLIGAILIGYLCLSVLVMIFSAVANLFGATVVFLSLLFFTLLPIFLIGSLLYIFVRMQSILPPIWKWIFLFLIAWLILIFCLN